MADTDGFGNRKAEKNIEGKKGHAELVKRFKKGEVGGREVFESAMKNKIKPKYNTDYPL